MLLPPQLPLNRTSPSYFPPSWTPIFGWLLCGKSSIGSRLRPRPCPSFCFLSFHLVTPNYGTTPPHTIQPVCASSSTYCSRQQSVDCYVLPLNGDHLMPRTHLSLYFLMGLALAPQTREPTVVPPMMARALCKHRKWRHHDLVVPLAYYPWRERSKAGGG